MMKQTLEICGRTLLIQRAKDVRPDTAVYLHAGTDEAGKAFSLLQARQAAESACVPDYALLSISGLDWNRDLSPWPAKKAFCGGEEFSGGAQAYLEFLTGRLLPAAEAVLGCTPRTRILAGYSMAGLFALYAAYRTGSFDRIACLSGSLWYDRFIEFMETSAPARCVKFAAFSLGDAEKNTKNQRLAAVEYCMYLAEQRLTTQGITVQHTTHPGGHFSNVVERIADGVWRTLCYAD